MAGDPKEKKRIIISFALLFGLSVSVAAQGIRTSVEAQNHPVDNQYSGLMLEETEHESVPPVRTPAPAEPLARGGSDTVGDAKKDLTAFFIIGFVINILLIGAFIFWAAQQWRKTKQE